MILCFLENFIRSGNLAISPLSFIISQITPEGLEFANLAISTTASVWPALIREPPSFDIRGKTCPGVVISFFVELISIAVLIVKDLSAADMPVVTPSVASIETVNAVSNLPSFLLSIRDKPSFSDWVRVNDKQISPLPYLAMKLIVSGEAYSPKTHRSPSFSLFSSSTKMNILPSEASFITSSILDKLN